MNIASLFIYVSMLFPALLHLEGFETQKYDYCGEASLAVMLSARGRTVTQDQAHDLLGLKGVKRGAYSGEILGGLRQSGYKVDAFSSFKYKGRAEAAAQGRKVVRRIKKEVEKGRLVFMGWYPWPSVTTRTGHFSLAAGVYPGGLIVADPRYGGRLLFIDDNAMAEALPLRSADSGLWGFFYFTLGERP